MGKLWSEAIIHIADHETSNSAVGLYLECARPMRPRGARTLSNYREDMATMSKLLSPRTAPCPPL